MLIWLEYIAFVFLTDWQDYGLTPQPEDTLRWSIIRIATVTIWLIVAALILRFHKQPANWQSFFYAFAVTGIIAILVAPRLISSNVNYLAIAGTLLIYALVSGALCVTIRKPIIGAVASPFLFALQVCMDLLAHLASGVFRLH